MSLMEQPWYWGNIPRDKVGEILLKQPDGSFLVRDASTPGDYTLSIKYLGQTKLVRIHVSDGKCGFAPDALTHNSVVQLVDFHRLRSLKIYNDQLDTCLRYPVNRRRKSTASESSSHSHRSLPPVILSRENSRVKINHPSSSGPSSSRETTSRRESVPHPPISVGTSSSFDFPTHESPPPVKLPSNDSPEWQRRLGLERLRFVLIAYERAARLYDYAHEELNRAESLEKAQESALEDLDRKLEILNDVRDVQINTKKSNLELNEHMKEVMNPNAEVVKRYIESLTEERAIVQSQLEKLLEMKSLLDSQAERSKNRLMTCNQDNNDTFLSLRNDLFPPALLDETSEKTKSMITQESMRVSQILADMPMTWHPARFLVNESNKDVAAALIQQTRARITHASRSMGTGHTPPQGIFLIRPSASQPSKLVLSVLNGDRVSHCLIEQTEQGWGFENGGLYFVTIGDFVRYYTHTSLVEHNPDINTCLTVPALPRPPNNSTKSPSGQ